MADQQSTGLLGLPPTVWIALVLGLAGAFAITQKPFQDTRPTSPNVPLNHHGDDKQAVEARLWEDPLTAVALARLQIGSFPLPVGTCDLANSIQGHASDNRRTLVLGVMVPGAPYTEDIETRRRARYAVLAGLYRADFLPVNRDHVGYLFINPGSTNGRCVVVERPGAPRDARNPDKHDIAAFEWFQRDNSAIPAASGSESNGTGPEDLPRSDHVLLLWLDQEGFRELPIRALSNIFKSIAPQENPLIEFAVLGPADSDGLHAMHVEAQRASAGEHWPEDLRPMAFYSSRATASDASVLGLSPGTEKRLASELYESNDRIRFFRTVSDDQEVADAVATELHEMRGIDRSEIALVAERDTLYARGMGSYFGGCKNPPRADPSTPAERSGGEVMCFTYLRGLDGIAPNTAPALNATSQTSSGNPGGSGASASASPASAASDAATGPGQLDYLRRLAGTIAALRQASPRIRAIGVISSDVYDKLLVLQALRSALPSVTYFTFDLDARFVEQRNLKTTRQLIVGSSLGLALRHELQGDIPPFRDTYQSTTFFATMLAVHRFVDSETANADQPQRAISQGEKPKLPQAPQCRTARLFDPAQRRQVGLQWTASPRIFEIGRTREFDLSEPNSEACSFDCDCKAIAAVRTWWWGTSPPAPKGLLAGLILSASCLLALALAHGRMAVIGQSKTLRIPGFGSRRWSNATASLVLVALLTAATTLVWPWLVEAITYSGKRVPTPLTGGANQWTPSIIDLLSILTVILLVVRGQRKLHDNGEAIRRELGFEIKRQELIHWHRKQLGHNKFQAGLLSLLWFPIHPLPRRSGVELARDTVSPLEAVMAQYLNHGTAIARFLRVICTAVVSVALLVALEAIPGIAVFRPSIDAISLASLFAMQFLILWTADALLLSRSFILTLSRDQPAWPAAALQKERNALGLDQERATLWLDLRLIGRLTDDVAGLVWYPSFVIATSTIALLTIQFREFQFANNPIALVAGALFVIASAIALRSAAEAFRRGTRDRLEDDRLREQKAGGGSAAQLDSLLNRVAALRDGAFAPYSEQPIVRAVLVPAATYGATVVLQYLQTGG